MAELSQLKSGPQALTVSDLNRQVKRLLEVSFNRVWIRGELSSFSRPASGHWYFSLKDGKSQVRCAMFKGFNQRLRFLPKEGEEVLVLAKVSLYEGRGDYQLIVEGMEPSGIGQLQATFEELKAKLNKEGLFDESRKQTIPSFPSRAYVITSATGAAIHDILAVSKRRYPLLKLILIPVQVQGNQAAQEIANAIELANQHKQADLILVGRGGGSLEDLWAFNEEKVARAISASELPVVSAVGHEVDFTIADFVADYRAPTPSAAAEKITPDQYELMQLFDQYQGQLLRQILNLISFQSSAINHLRARLQHPGDALATRQQRISELNRQLQRLIQSSLETKAMQLDAMQSTLQNHSPVKQTERMALNLAHLHEKLYQNIQKALNDRQHSLGLAARSLHIASPLATLGRGYAIVGTEEKSVLRSYKDVSAGDEVNATLAEGSLKCVVKETLPEGLSD